MLNKHVCHGFHSTMAGWLRTHRRSLTISQTPKPIVAQKPLVATCLGLAITTSYNFQLPCSSLFSGLTDLGGALGLYCLQHHCLLSGALLSLQLRALRWALLMWKFRGWRSPVWSSGNLWPKNFEGWLISMPCFLKTRSLVQCELAFYISSKEKLRG